jgi:signal transduction histidine kinase
VRDKDKLAVRQRPEQVKTEGRLYGEFVKIQEECRRLGLDLHRSTAQSLAALTINLDLIAKQPDALDPRSRQMLDESASIARQCFHEIRTLAELLYPALAEQVGAPGAVEWHVARFRGRSEPPPERDGRTTPPAADGAPLLRLMEACIRDIQPAFMSLKQIAGNLELTIRQRKSAGRAKSRTSSRSAFTMPFDRTLYDRILQFGGTVDIRGSTLRVRVPIEGA